MRKSLNIEMRLARYGKEAVNEDDVTKSEIDVAYGNRG